MDSEHDRERGSDELGVAMVTAVETDPEAVEVVVWDGEKKRSLTGIALNVEGLGGELVLLCEASATETTG